MVNDSSNTRTSLNMKTLRPEKTASKLLQLGYVGLLVACGTLVGKCVLDFADQSSTVHAASDIAKRTDLSPIEARPFERVVDSATEKRIAEILNGTDPRILVSKAIDSQPSLESVPKSSIAEPRSNSADMPDAEFLSIAPAEKSVADKRSSPAIRQNTQLHDDMITPGNFVYVGGFRPEFGDNTKSRFGLGGLAVTYRPDGDPDGSDDGFPGSLFMVGHGHHQMVAEISIPSPRVSLKKKIDDLPVAKILQPFADVTGGLRDRMTDGSSEPFEIGGLQVLNDKLHWTLYKYYNIARIDYPSHGLSSVHLNQKRVRGLWHLGPSGTGQSQWHSYKNAGYITDIPQPIADKYFGGRQLMSGLQISTGRQTSSQGPALYAYKIDDENLPFGESLDAVPLLWYPMSAPLEQHDPTDKWQGAAWLTLGGKQAVVVVGRKGHAPYHYGMPNANDCYDYKGYHAASYEAQMLFYRPQDLVAGARRSVPNTSPWYRWDSTTPGGGLDRFMYQQCKKQIGGMTLDRKRNLLYIVEVDAGLSEVNAYEALPVVHVFRIVE